MIKVINSISNFYNQNNKNLNLYVEKTQDAVHSNI